MGFSAFVLLFFIGVFAAAVLYFERTLETKRAAVTAVVLIFAAMALRGCFMNYETLDYQDFLSRWVQFFRDNGGFSALKYSVGNYNVPYLYFLALFSRVSIPDLYLIKALSVLFDVLMAWAVMRIVYLFKKTPAAVLTGFFVTLFLPTVVLNGAVWGQCDSIYTALALWSIYFALEGRGCLSMVFIALSFSFKLQAVFIMPVFLVFIFAGNVRWRQLPLFPLTYILAVLPAVLAGRPALETVTLYFSQAGSVGDALSYNASSIFAFMRNSGNTRLASLLGIAAAAVFLAIVFFWAWCERRRLTKRALLVCTLLICAGVPFFLPHMHDRYFFMADVLSAALAVTVPVLAPLPVLVSFGSLLGYYAYFKMRFLLPMRYGACAMILVIAVCAVYMTLSLRPAGRREGG